MRHWPAAPIPVIITLMLLCTRTPSRRYQKPSFARDGLVIPVTLPPARDPTGGPLPMRNPKLRFGSPTPAPYTHVPLFRPQEANPETGTPTPRYQYAPSGNFFKKSFPINSGIFLPPRVMGPRAARISNGFWVEGLAGAGRLTEYPSGSVTRLLGRDRASTQGLVQDWGRCRWRCPQRARSARRRATAPRADFFLPAASGVSPICKGSDIRIDMEKLAEGRIVAS